MAGGQSVATVTGSDCHGWDSNTISGSQTDLSRRRERLDEQWTVGTAQNCRAVATWVRIPPLSPKPQGDVQILRIFTLHGRRIAGSSHVCEEAMLLNSCVQEMKRVYSGDRWAVVPRVSHVPCSLHGKGSLIREGCLCYLQGRAALSGRGALYLLRTSSTYHSLLLLLTTTYYSLLTTAYYSRLFTTHLVHEVQRRVGLEPQKLAVVARSTGVRQ